MKNILLYLLLPIYGFGQYKTASKVVSVVIYKSGAQVTREAVIDLKDGDNSLVFKGISPELDKNSIQIKFSDSNVSLNFLSSQPSLNNEEEYLVASVKNATLNTKLNESKKKLQIEKALLSYQEKMLLNNQNVGGTYTGMKPEDLIKTVDYFEGKMKKILLAQLVIQMKMDSLDFEIRENNLEVNLAGQKKENQLSEILLGVKSKGVKNQAKLTISYFLQNAGWTPTYDFIAKSLDNPLTIIYKSKIFQYSGEDWKDVKVTLSNSIPKKSAGIPELKMWIWGIPNDYSKEEVFNLNQKNLTDLFGTVKDEEGKPLPGVNIQLNGTSLGTATDVIGDFRISIPNDRLKENHELTFSFIGYVSQKIKVKEVPFYVSLIPDNQKLEEVVVIGYGVQTKKEKLGSSTVVQGKVSGLSVIAGSKLSNTRTLIEEKESSVSVEFTLKELITLNSDGKEKSVDLKEIEIPVEYLYKTIPKIEPAAFLYAKIIDWEQYNFLEGEANLYFEGTYIGKSLLDLNNKDTLSFSLGRDPSIIVSRKQSKKFSKKQTLGSTIQDNVYYEISIRNTKNQPISILVNDQFPISNNKEVDVSNQEALEGNVDKDSGLISWKLDLKKTTEKIVQFSYSVKYPKNQYVTY